MVNRFTKTVAIVTASAELMAGCAGGLGGEETEAQAPSINVELSPAELLQAQFGLTEGELALKLTADIMLQDFTVDISDGLYSGQAVAGLCLVNGVEKGDEVGSLVLSLVGNPFLLKERVGGSFISILAGIDQNGATISSDAVIGDGLEGILNGTPIRGVLPQEVQSALLLDTEVVAVLDVNVNTNDSTGENTITDNVTGLPVGNGFSDSVLTVGEFDDFVKTDIAQVFCASIALTDTIRTA